MNINRINSNSSVFKLTCKKWIEHNSIESIAMLKFQKRDYSTTQVKQIAKEQKQLVRTSGN